jgi:hypothetical protein
MSELPTSLELAIDLPLGVVANQLRKVESDLRFLSAKSATHGDNRGNGNPASQVAARLEQINETLESIRALLADIERDLQPKSASAGRRRDDRDD